MLLKIIFPSVSHTRTNFFLFALHKHAQRNLIL